MNRLMILLVILLFGLLIASMGFNCERSGDDDDDSNDILYSKCDSSNWYIYTIDLLAEALPSSTPNYDASLAIDPNDNPHLIYTSYNLKYSDSKDEDDVEYEEYVFYLKYAKKELNKWKFYNIAKWDDWLEVSPYVDTDIAIDSDGTPHITHASYAGLYYVTKTSGNWQLLYLDGCDGAAIAVDSKNRAHIACGGEKLKYITNSSGAWQSWPLDHSNNPYSYYSSPSITVDSSDNVHIAYNLCQQDEFSGEERCYLKYITSSLDTPSPQTIISGLSSFGYVDIAVDSDSHLHISYINSDRLKYLVNSGYNWTFSEIDNAPEIRYSSIDIAPDNSVHISYLIIHSEYIDNSLKYATNKTGTWQIFTLDSGADSGYFPSLALDSNGCVHISYFNNSTDDLMYATNRKPR